MQLWKRNSRFCWGKILERIERLEVKSSEYQRENTEKILQQYDEAVKNLTGFELARYIASCQELVRKAEEVLGA